MVELLPRDHEGDAVGHLGPDLLGPDWDPDEAVRRLAADPDREIGQALLDQRNLAGIGNLYQAEVCFLLGVSPWTPVRDGRPRRRSSTGPTGCSTANKEHVRPRSPPATRGAGAETLGVRAGRAGRAAAAGRRSGPPSRATRPTSGCRTGARAASPADGRGARDTRTPVHTPVDVGWTGERCWCSYPGGDAVYAATLVTCSGVGAATGTCGSSDRQRLGERQVVADLAQHLGERDVERLADRAEQLGGRFLLPALDLGQVAEGDPGGGRDLAQGAALLAAALAQHVTEQAAEQDHRGNVSFAGRAGRLVAISTVRRWAVGWLAECNAVIIAMRSRSVSAVVQQRERGGDGRRPHRRPVAGERQGRRRRAPAGPATAT